MEFKKLATFSQSGLTFILHFTLVYAKEIGIAREDDPACFLKIRSRRLPYFDDKEHLSS